MAETGWPLIPREVLPAPVQPAARGRRAQRATPSPDRSEAGRQLSIFGAETTEPSPLDLAGLLAGPGRIDRMGGTARVAVTVDAGWRVHVLVAELVSRGLVVHWRPLDDVRRAPSPPESGAPAPTGGDDPPAAPPPPAPARPRVPTEPAEPAEPDDVLDPDPPEFVDPTLDDDSGVIGAGRPRRSDPPPDAPDDPAPDDPAPDDPAPDDPAPEAPPAAGNSDDTGPTPDEGAEPARVLFEVRTAYSSRLNGLARAWPADADQLFLGGPRLRLWVAAAGRPVDGGYALGLAARAGDHDPRTWPAVDAALRRTGLDGVLSDHGLDVVISGRKRLARLAELVGQRPDAAPAEFWPGGATA